MKKISKIDAYHSSFDPESCIVPKRLSTREVVDYAEVIQWPMYCKLLPKTDEEFHELWNTCVHMAPGTKSPEALRFPIRRAELDICVGLGDIKSPRQLLNDLKIFCGFLAKQPEGATKRFLADELFYGFGVVGQVHCIFEQLLDHKPTMLEYLCDVHDQIAALMQSVGIEMRGTRPSFY